MRWCPNCAAPFPPSSAPGPLTLTCSARCKRELAALPPNVQTLRVNIAIALNLLDGGEEGAGDVLRAALRSSPPPVGLSRARCGTREHVEDMDAPGYCLWCHEAMPSKRGE